MTEAKKNGPLPLGVSRANFEEAIKELRNAVGSQWVFTHADDQLSAYGDHFALRERETREVSAAVAPAGVEEIQKVLAVARNYKIPLWTISTGRNLAYGGPAPRKAGAIVLDLKRMNRIIEVNEKHAYAIVEPGVSYFDLYNYIQSKGYKLWIDCPAPGWGGVLGNLCDRGNGYTPYGDHFEHLSGMQVVLADGSVVETGMAGQPGHLAEHTYRYGRGPWVDGIFTQSNFGVVTRMGVHLMPEPPGYRPYMIAFPKLEDLVPVTDIIRELKLALLIPNAAVTADPMYEAGVQVTRAQYYSGKGPIPDSIRKKMISDLGIGFWNFSAALYGPKPWMDANWEIIADAFNQVPGAKFHTEEDRGDNIVFRYRKMLQSGIPNLVEFNLLNWIPGGAHVDFSPNSPVDGADALNQYHIIRNTAESFDFDYMGGFFVGWRDMHHILALLFDRTSEDEKKRARECFSRLIDIYADRGLSIYRTHPEFMDQVARTHSWNDHALWRLFDQLKDQLDPDGILAPGKSGVWPEHLRNLET